MSEANSMPNVAEQQKQPEAIAGAAPDWGVGSMLNAQADLLAGAEATVTHWLQRRHEAVLDIQQLIAGMHIGTNTADVLKAQQEWVSRSFRRLAADADAYQSVTQRLLDRASSWFPQGGLMWFPRGPSSPESSATQAAATRAAGRPLRMANKSE
jgi:hypothetical protein